jgi:hypothetical protein
VYALYIGPVVARQHACAAGRKKLRCSEGAGFTVTLAPTRDFGLIFDLPHFC